MYCPGGRASPRGRQQPPCPPQTGTTGWVAVFCGNIPVKQDSSTAILGSAPRVGGSAPRVRGTPRVASVKYADANKGPCLLGRWGAERPLRQARAGGVGGAP